MSVQNLLVDSGAIVDNGDGIYIFTPDTNFYGTVNLTYKVSDGTQSIDATNSFEIAAVNDPPALTGTQATLPDGIEDTPYTIYASDLLEGFDDPEGDILSVQNLLADNGTITNNNDGTYTFTPDANFYGTVNLAYEVSDETTSFPTTNSFEIVAVNDHPSKKNSNINIIDLGNFQFRNTPVTPDGDYTPKRFPVY